MLFHPFPLCNLLLALPFPLQFSESPPLPFLFEAFPLQCQALAFPLFLMCPTDLCQSGLLSPSLAFRFKCQAFLFRLQGQTFPFLLEGQMFSLVFERLAFVGVGFEPR